jgi:hypothetical protein
MMGWAYGGGGSRGRVPGSNGSQRQRGRRPPLGWAGVLHRAVLGAWMARLTGDGGGEVGAGAALLWRMVVLAMDGGRLGPDLGPFGPDLGGSGLLS